MSSAGLDPATEIERNTPNFPWSVTNKQRPGFLLDGNFPSTYGQSNMKPEEVIEADKNAVNYLKAALESKGIKTLAVGPEQPGSKLPEMTDKDIEKFSKTKEGKKLIEDFIKDTYTSELNNAYTNTTLTPKDRTVLNNKIRVAPQSLLYYDKEGNQLEFGSSDWEKATGGKFSEFEHSNTLSPLNVRAGKIGEDAAASGLHTVIGKDADGKPKVFYVADPAYNNPITRNANIIYNKGYSKPGIPVTINGGYSIKYLVGQQKLDALVNQPVEERARLQEQGIDISKLPLIEVSKGDQVWLADPNTFGKQLAEEGISLSYKK
jgi:hypothetical protein